MIKGLLKQPGCQSVACSSQFLFKIKERCWKNMIKVLLKQPAHSSLDANVLLVHHCFYLNRKEKSKET